LATPGKKGSYTARNAGTIKLKSAVYNPAKDQVTIIPKTPSKLAKPVQVLVYGTTPNGLQDSEGRLIDGDHNGAPGGNAIAIFSKTGVTIDAITLAQFQGKQAPAAVVDALLDRGDLLRSLPVTDGRRHLYRVESDRARH
jgi:hypothetical protein